MPLNISDQELDAILTDIFAQSEYTLIEISQQTLNKQLRERLPQIDQRTQEVQAAYLAAQDKQQEKSTEWLKNTFSKYLLWPVILGIAIVGTVVFSIIAQAFSTGIHVPLWIQSPVWWSPLAALLTVLVADLVIQWIRFQRRDEELYDEYGRSNGQKVRAETELKSVIRLEIEQALGELTATMKNSDWREGDLNISSSRLVESQSSDLYQKVNAEGSISDFITG